MLSILIFVIASSLVYQTMSSFIFKPSWKSEGQGAKVIRVIGNQFLKDMDPFLMLDLFKVRLPAGFPDHPHRGFETVTYMLNGSFYHQDFKGHKGKIEPGDLQWMTAGKGILHSQMPASFDQDSYGFQLWINLSKDLKMIDPQYQEYKSSQLKTVKKEKASIKIISGQWEGFKGPILARTPTYYFDISLDENGSFNIPIPKSWNTIIFVYEGDINYKVNGKSKQVKNMHCCFLQNSESQEIIHEFESPKSSKFVLIGGKPLGQPIAKYGPFVMNSQKQIQEAFADYKGGKNGFEGNHAWQSKIKLLASGKKSEQL